jgi:hypothetical protein
MTEISQIYDICITKIERIEDINATTMALPKKNHNGSFVSILNSGAKLTRRACLRAEATLFLLMLIALTIVAGKEMPLVQFGT